MKKFLLSLVALLAIFVGSSWAADVTLAGVTNGSACTVNGKDGIKVGTSKAGGAMTITVPAYTTKLTLHAAAWNGVNGLSVEITGATASPASLTLNPNTGISGSSTDYTLSEGSDEDAYKFEVALSNVTSETTLTLSASKRFVVWDASAETATVIQVGKATGTYYKADGSIPTYEGNDIWAAMWVSTQEDPQLTLTASSGINASNGMHFGVDGVTYTLTVSDGYAIIAYALTASGFGAEGSSTLTPEGGEGQPFVVGTPNGASGLSAQTVTFTISVGRVAISNFEVVVVKVPAAPAVAAPVFDPAGGKFIGSQLVTITCEEGAEIRYTIDGTNPTAESQRYTPFTVSETTTVKAIAIKDEAVSDVAEATFTIVPAYSTIAELNALANNATFAFTGEALVVAKPTDKHVYIHDNSGNSLIYDNSGTLTAAAEVGKFINPNWTGKVSIYKQLFELVPDEAITVGVSTYPISYPDFSTREINKVVSLKDVESITANGSNLTINVKGADKSFEESYQLAGYNQFGIEIPAAEEDKLYEVIGAVGKYNDNLQFWPIEIKEQVDEPIVPEPDPEFYVVGNMTDWQIVEANKMTLNEELDKTGVKEFSLDMTLAANDQFKVVSSTDGSNIKEWFPAEGDNYVITEAGEYTIYFRPEGQEDWFGNYLKAEKKAAPEPAWLGPGYYVFKNVATGQFFARGNGWDTQASITEAGKEGNAITVELVSVGDNYQILTGVGGASNGLEALNSGTIYTDQSRNKQSTWNFIEVAGAEGHVYNIVSVDNHGGGAGKYMVANASSTVVDPSEDGTSKYAQWELIKLSDIQAKALAELASATVATPVDATPIVLNANFSSPAIKEAWTAKSYDETAAADNANLSGGNGNNPCAESWRSGNGFNVKQTLTVPNGVYTLTAQAALTEYTVTGADLPVVYANDATATFLAMANGEDSMGKMSTQFSAGNYVVGPLFVKVEDGSLMVGVKGSRSDTWNIWDNFVLTYYGDVDINDVKFAALVAELKESIATAKSFDGELPATAKSDYSTLIANAEGAEYNTAEDYETAIESLNAGYASAKALSADYVAFVAMKTNAQAVVDGTEGGSEEATALANALTEQAAAVETVALNGTIPADATTTIVTACKAYINTIASVTKDIDDIDVTPFVITNATPTVNHDGWTVINGTKGNDWAGNTYDAANNVAEFWQYAGSTIKQAVSLPAGDFKLSAQAVTRTNMVGTLFAGENKVNIVTMPASGEGTGLTDGVDGLNSRVGCNKWFNAGNGWNEVEFTLAEASEIEIGITSDSETGDHWTVWRGFKLEIVAPVTTYAINIAEAENGKVESDVAVAAEGATVTLTVTPDEGYELDALTVMAGETPVRVAEDNTFVMPAADVNVAATFKEKAAEPEKKVVVKMTYVSNESEEGDADKAFGEVEEAKAGFNKIANGEVGFGNTAWGRNYITYIQADASAFAGVVKKATMTAEVSGTIDANKRVAVWGVGYNNSTWSADMTYNTADKSITLIDGATYTTTSKNAETFENVEFDITAAFAEGKVATLLVYETAAAGALIKNVKVEVEMGDPEINVNGIIYAVKSENLFKNGSFDNGVEGWKTVGYTTDAVASDFTLSAEGGYDGGAFITTDGAGVGSEKTIRQSVAVTEGKSYYFAVRTSGKAPDAKNFNYNALFKMTDAVTETENGVIKAFEWPQGAGQTATEWSLTETVFTAETGFVGVRMGWNASSSFDGFELYEVEMLTSALDAAKAIKIAAIDALAPVGEGLFFYSQADIDNAKAAVNAAETIEAVEAVEMPVVKAPDAEKTYSFQLRLDGETPLYMNLAEGGITIAEAATALKFMPTENAGQYNLVNEDGTLFVGLAGGDAWTMSTAPDKKAAWTFTALGDGAYRINNLVTAGRFVGTNAADKTAGSPCYADKKTDNGNVDWVIAEYVAPVVPETYVINITPAENGRVAADKAEAAEGETVTVTVIPADGYTVDEASWSYFGADGALQTNEFTEPEDASNSATFVMPAADVTITVTFKLVTGINGIAADSEKAVIFDMNGRRVSHNAKGILIINGNKVVRK